MTDVHPNPEKSRRDSDQSTAAKLAWSPWFNLGHVSTSILMLVTLATIGANNYARFEQTVDRSLHNQKSQESLEGTVGQLVRNTERVESMAHSNQANITRVERQAQQDRQEIIRRLESMDDALRELNRFLRNAVARQSGESVDKTIANEPYSLEVYGRPAWKR